MARLLDANPEPIPDASIEYSPSDRGYVVHFVGMCSRQEKYLNQIAERAALDVLKRELAVDGWVRSFDD